jgi:mannose-6-phosphate isomerase-like protein (cupin superfamily)
MIQYLQLPYRFDVVRMQQETKQLGDDLWKLHFQVKHYDGNWSAILLRSINGDINNGFISPVEGAAQYADTVLLQQSVYLKEVLETFKCPLLSVRLLKLSAGTQIHEHKDADLCFEEGLVRFHIPVCTNEAVEFYLNKERMYLSEGDCWYMNFNLPHALHNKSNTDRIHLVIDAEVNDWVKELFRSFRIKNRKDIADIPKHTKETQLEIIMHLRKMNTPASLQLADELENQLV